MNSAQGFSDFFYSAPDGLRLHARIYGGYVSGPLPAICLPGLTRNARDFHELALYLSRDAATPRMVVSFDYRGRGQSAHDRNWRNYNVITEAEDILAGLTAMGIAHGAFIGTSRGGLIIHVLAGMRPAAMKAAILNDIGPVVEGAGLAHIRAYLQRAPRPKSLEDAVAIQRATHGQAFSALSDADWERFVHALYRIEDGRLMADYDPALLKTLTNLDLNTPLPVLWPQFQGLCNIPLIAIRGANSRLLSAETLEEMTRRHPAMEAVTVAGQGHAPLLETANLPQKIAAFLAKADGKAQ